MKHGVILEILTGGKHGAEDKGEEDGSDADAAMDDIEASGVKITDREKFLAGMRALVAQCMDEYESEPHDEGDGKSGEGHSSAEE